MANLNNEQNEMLIAAVGNGDFAALQSLVDEDGGNIHFKNEHAHGASLLHQAAYFGSFPCLEFLLVKGISAIVKNNLGMTPLHFCFSGRSFTNEWTNIFQLLLDHGADIEEKCNIGNTPLIYASANGSSDMVQFLLNKGANVNAKNNSNLTPIHFASKKSYEQIARMLLDNGADLAAKNTNGETALDVAGSDKMKNAILAHKLGMTSRENDVLRRELQVLREDHQDVRNFIFAVFGNMDRTRPTTATTTTTTSDEI